MTKNYYKVWQELKSVTVITKWDRKLLQSVTGITKCNRKLLQSVTDITKCDGYYKVGQNISKICDRKLLQSVTGITNCDNKLLQCYIYHKVWQLLQNET